MELNITTSKTYRDIDESKKICILQGGTRSSKSYSALQWILVHCLMEPNIVVSVVRKSFPSMRVSIMRDWQTILKQLEIWSDDNWSATEHIYTFDNGSMVEFMSIDSSEKRKGSARDYLFIEDAVRAYFLVMKSLLNTKSLLRIYNVGSKYNLNVKSIHECWGNCYHFFNC